MLGRTHVPDAGGRERQLVRHRPERGQGIGDGVGRQAADRDDRALAGAPAAIGVGPLRSRLFLRGWRNVPLNNQVDPPTFGDESGASRNLGAISLEPRIAFLLSAVESFGPGEIAQTLDCSEKKALELVEHAGREISAQIRTKVLIIEDEPLIALDIQTLVEQLGHDVTTIARTHTEAVRAALKNRPGLILADIQLADGSSGLEAVNEILGSREVPVIFITAFPERFLTGRAPEPAFLITKAFSADSVKAVISQALFFDRRSQRTDAKAEAG